MGGRAARLEPLVIHPAEPPAVELRGLRKNYHGLRPLRIDSLVVGQRDRVAIGGLDAAAAELLVNLLTGATLPDEGDILILGESTASIANETAWLAALDRFGIVSPRAVLLEQSSLAQNLALPFTLSLDPIPVEVTERIERLAGEVGIAPACLGTPMEHLGPDVRLRAHLARAIALAPAVLVLEHPTAGLPRRAVPAFGADVSRIAATRRLTVLALTEDDRFARLVARQVLRLQPATGGLVQPRRGWLW